MLLSILFKSSGDLLVMAKIRKKRLCKKKDQKYLLERLDLLLIDKSIVIPEIASKYTPNLSILMV